MIYIVCIIFPNPTQSRWPRLGPVPDIDDVARPWHYPRHEDSQG
jgi:hypothetical protein